jgi:hypothetical protein
MPRRKVIGPEIQGGVPTPTGQLWGLAATGWAATPETQLCSVCPSKPKGSTALTFSLGYLVKTVCGVELHAPSADTRAAENAGPEVGSKFPARFLLLRPVASQHPNLRLTPASIC